MGVPRSVVQVLLHPCFHVLTFGPAPGTPGAYVFAASHFTRCPHFMSHAMSHGADGARFVR